MLGIDVFHNHPAILVVEDEPFIAMDVALAVEDAGGRVIGPAASVAEAFALLKIYSADGAILDVNVLDGDVTPVVEHLVSQHVPLIIQTGVGLPDVLAAQFPDIIVLIKPVITGALIDTLASLLVRAG